ncbi:MAG: uroporphyrinogen-III C-methyltransferase [Desulfohalobiaceae bacterium]|nr:uroporphyrinogen-III C-methyltransferase [Desulfohalobiaceae bacterium]
MGKVYLLGAGPGDPGLLTLKAREVLSSADCVVYDYLANERFLDDCRSDAELVYVGKKGGEHTLSQEGINELLVQKALEGKRVARLKGGDPYVFGRGAEEAEQLLEAGVEFEVVPGVTSAVAGPAYAGIPLTHREYASSVTFITGHEDPKKKKSAHNWKALAQSGSTLVFFMGVKNLARITDNLLKAGLAPETPAALVRWGTTCEQESLAAPLAEISERAREQNMKPPALLVVGQVVELREKLNWFEKLPLFGKGVVVTRAREQASSLLRILQDQGACCYQFPTIAIKALDDYSGLHRAFRNLTTYDWLIFTSVNGVRVFWKELAGQGLDSRSLGGCLVAAIGPATAGALRERGIEPDFVPDKYVAEHVVQGLVQRGISRARILLPRAEKARDVLPEALVKAGAEVDVLPVYRTRPAEESGVKILEAIREGKVHFITFTSSSTVENFFHLVSAKDLSMYVPGQVKLACIGPVTAGTLQRHGFQADLQPEDYTVSGLAGCLRQAVACS